jgi:pilus assembly protein CpaE
MRIISSDLGLRRERIEVVINRFAKNSVIELDDIRKTLGVDQLHIVPNQYRLVAESIDTGKPVVQSARNSTVARALRELGAKVSGTNGDDVRRGNFLTRTLPNVFGAN